MEQGPSRVRALGGTIHMAGAVEDVTAAEWESKVLRSQRPVAVDFWHEQCTWCKRLDPEYAATASGRSGQMAFLKLHVFRENEVARRYGIQGTPTIKFFCGAREVHEVVGFRPRAALEKEVDMVLANYADCLKQSTPVAAG